MEEDEGLEQPATSGSETRLKPWHRRTAKAGITAAAFPGTEKTYDTVDEVVIRGPLVSALSPRKRAVEPGVIDQATDFVARNMGTTAWLEGGRRRRKKAFASEAVREAIVNAVAHRDYLLTQTDIEISLYADRLEIISPGRLPNGVTVPKMRDGVRAARNELVKEILRDYGYIEHLGMGVRRKIIEAMREHNGTEVDLEEEDDRRPAVEEADRGQALNSSVGDSSAVRSALRHALALSPHRGLWRRAGLRAGENMLRLGMCRTTWRAKADSRVAR